MAEEWGGNTPMVPVSAKKGTGVADLLQMVSWVAEEKKLVANAKRPGALGLSGCHVLLSKHTGIAQNTLMSRSQR